MLKLKDPLLFKLIHSFLTEYLPNQRAYSNNTIKSYRTALSCFLTFASERKKIPLSQLTFDLLNQEMVKQFINSLEQSKQNMVSTCNHRLACIRSFFKYASAMEPTLTIHLLEIEKVPIKNTPKQSIEYMSETAVSTILSIPDITTEKGIRDQFLMVMLYDTGARIQEILSLKIEDVHLGKTPIIFVTGKGNKKRSIPLMKQTVKQFSRYMNIFHPSSESSEYLFYVVQKGFQQKMSDDNVRKLLHKYGEQARQICSEVPKNIYPHLWRHSRAMHLYQHGMDLTLISQWLGHAHLETTLIYAYADAEHKRQAIEKATPSDSPIYSNGGAKRFRIDDETLLKKLYGLK